MIHGLNPLTETTMHRTPLRTGGYDRFRAPQLVR